MDIKIKRWTHLGLGAALMTTTALASCGEPAAKEEPAASEQPAADAPSEAEVEAKLDEVNGAAAASGEGEGGVAIEAALTDPVVYNIALTVAEAHVVAARDAYRDGEKDAAAEMFAHPVSEVLFDMEPVFEARGVSDFTDQFLDASQAVMAGESVDEINARTAAIIATLRTVSGNAPDDGSSPAAITTGVVADMIDRGTKMYRPGHGVRILRALSRRLRPSTPRRETSSKHRRKRSPPRTRTRLKPSAAR